MRWFWKKVALFAYRRWRRPEDKMPTGIPGYRDPDALCNGYDPAPAGGWDCQSDGHYLCKECSHFRPPEYFDADSPQYLKIGVKR